MTSYLYVVFPTWNPEYIRVWVVKGYQMVLEKTFFVLIAFFV